MAGFRGSPERFARRLGLERCSEKELLRVLGTSPENLFPQDFRPYWLIQILDAESDAIGPATFSSQALDEYSQRGIICPFVPIIRHYSNRLMAEAAKITSLRETFDLPSDFIDPFLASFLPTFEQRVRRAVVLEVNSLRILGQLEGATPSDRFKDFVKTFSHSDRRLDFLQKYPVLARYAQRALEAWVQASLEFLNHLTTDRERIHTLFGVGLSDRLVAFHPSGDTHNQGRSVVALTFQSGKKILYKPRNLEIDLCFQELLSWCNANGVTPHLRTMKVASSDHHGWVEFVELANTTDDQEFDDFYVRLGSLLAILYSIETVDVHFENLVAAGSDPVVVDLETLFHTHIQSTSIKSASDVARRTIDASVMSIGILPKPTLSDNGRKTFDISGIGASIGQQAPYTVVGIDNFGRDDIRITRIPGWIPSAHNRPDEANNRPIPSREILKGFCSTYDVLHANKDLLVAPDGPLASFRKCTRRVIVRDTKRYGALQVDAFHPDLLRDDLDRSWHWDNLWSDAVQRPVVEGFIESELNQIEMNDIPHFTVKVDGSEIVGADGTAIQGFEMTSGWDAVLHRIAGFSVEDKRRQSWFIRAALGQTTDYPNRPLSAGVANHLLRGACEIGDEIVRNLIWHGNSASFLKVVSIVGENQLSGGSYAIDDADQGIYEGRGGVILFLAYLGRESQQEKYSEAAKALLNTISIQHANRVRPHGISGFLGNGSLAFLYTHLAVIWNDSTFLEEAELCVERLLPSIDSDRSYDLLTGSAGCILSILPLASVSPRSKAREAAIRCGNHLLEKQPNGEPNWMGLQYKRGLAHGFAGVAMALHQLGQQFRKAKYSQESLKVIEHENSLLQDGQWTDSHQLNGKCQVSWCHGAPGVALGRLAMYHNCSSASLRQDIAYALNEIISSHQMPSHCLCHGTLGNLEPLLVAKHYPEFSERAAKVHDFFRQTLETIVSEGWRSLLPSQTLSLGLMTGLSGVGYSLLRFHASDRIPSVLMLQGPHPMHDVHKSTDSPLRKRLSKRMGAK